MLVIDKSSSMLGLINGTNTSKWSAARDAVKMLTTKYENQIDLGLMIFPQPDKCGPGTVLVEMASGNSAKIEAQMKSEPPSKGNYTPMSQSIDAAIEDPLLGDSARKPSILLVTDGWQWCSPYDSSTRFWPVESVMTAHDLGINVYVVGFGSDVDVLTLNKMAHVSGTEIKGCDPKGSMLSSPNKCYYQVDDLPSLTTALDQIGLMVSAEVCDGADNNCDGQVDENLQRTCVSACGSGMETCDKGTWLGCSALLPTMEVCNGKDDDCNNIVDDPTLVKCPEGQKCEEGQCVPTVKADLGVEPDMSIKHLEAPVADVPAGCGCVLGGRGAGRMGTLLLGVGLALLLSRRRLPVA